MIDPSNYESLTDDEIQILQQCSYQLTLSIDELTIPAIKNRLVFNRPPRPQNSWIIFRRDYEAYLRCRPGIKQEVKHMAQECSMKWRHLSNEDKFFFKILEKIACANHKRIYPNYKYNPKNAKTSNCKKFIFREQKRYLFTSSPKPSKLSSTFVKSPAPSLNQVMNTTHSVTNANSHTPSSTINDDISLTFDTNGTDIVSTTLPSMFNANANLPSVINNDDVVDADEINTMSSQPAIRIQTTIKTLPSMLNDNSLSLPSTINDKPSSLIDTDRIDNDRLKIMPNYYVFEDMNDINVSNVTIPILTNFQSHQYHIVSTTINTLPSMLNVNSPILPSTINDDASLLIDTGSIDSVSTTINTLPFVSNANSPSFPSTINGDTTLLMGIVNDTFKTMSDYYINDVGAISVSNKTISNS